MTTPNDEREIQSCSHPKHQTHTQPTQPNPYLPPYHTNTSLHSSEERWRSEGIQIGGPRSGRGVLGNWFDKDFDRHGPAGPTAFWKVSDYIDEDGKDGEEEQSEGSLGDEDSEGDEEYMSD
jgi:hypothetical protein